MKYLRKYNESIDQDDIVLNCLDLIDNGFEIQELSGGLSKFIFRLERRDTISLPDGVDLHNLDWLEENYPENTFFIIEDYHSVDLYRYKVSTNSDKKITKLQRELLVDLVSITERLARYLRRDDIAAKISFTNMFRRDGGAILTYNDICIDFLFEQATKLIPKLESVVNKKDEYIEKLRWNIPKQGQMFIDLMKEEMAYLFDDPTWEVNMECGATAVITLQKRDGRYIDTFRWSDVKDYLIPFLRRNKDDWKFFDFKWNDKNCKAGENVKIGGYSHGVLDVKKVELMKDVTRYFTIEDLINDSDKLNQVECIGGITFKIKMSKLSGIYR